MFSKPFHIPIIQHFERGLHHARGSLPSLSTICTLQYIVYHAPTPTLSRESNLLPSLPDEHLEGARQFRTVLRGCGALSQPRSDSVRYITSLPRSYGPAGTPSGGPGVTPSGGPGS